MYECALVVNAPVSRLLPEVDWCIRSRAGSIFLDTILLTESLPNRYNWPMSAHASQAFSIAHCTDSEDFPTNAPLSLKRRPTVTSVLDCCATKRTIQCWPK